jgi:hypothetical protein
MDWIDLAQDTDLWVASGSGNEPTGSVQCWEVHEYLSDCLLLKNDSAP